MRWYASARGQALGLFEENQILQLVRSGQIDHVQGEGGGNWMPIHQSPFAAYAAAPAAHASATSVAKPTASRASSSSGAQWVFVVGVVVAFIISSSLGWVGIGMGLGLVAWTIVRHRKGQRSLMAIAWSKPVGLLTTAGTVAIGLLFSTCGAGSVLSKRKVAADREIEAAMASAQADAQAKAKAQQRAELVAALPAALKLWKQRLADAQAIADKTDTVKGYVLSNAVRDELDLRVNTMGPPTPEALAVLAKESSAQSEALGARVALAESIASVDAHVGEAKAATRKQTWLSADKEYEAALEAIEKIQAAPPSAKGFIPPAFDPAKRRLEIELLRKAIAAPVAQERTKTEALARVEEIRASLNAGDRASYVAAKVSVTSAAKECGPCGAAPTIVALQREIDTTLANWPIDIGSVQELQTRYADLRGRRARVRASLGASTYYNCRYASQNDWRSFDLSDAVIGGIHVYCSRGDAGCESIFQPLASGGREPGFATIEYPSSNSVCEESQALLIRWEH